MYEPREDSFMLLRCVEHLEDKKVLDMGTGSGIIALNLAEKNEVTASDIDEECVDYVRKKAREKGLKVRCIKSDLFDEINEKFDIICFNPPYLPRDEHDEGRDTSGGIEVIERFLRDVKDHLNEKGEVYLVFSSLTGDVFELIDNLGYEFEVLMREHYFFEDIYVVKLWLRSL